MDLYRTLARDFALELEATLTPEEMGEVIRRNLAETDPNVCHSHDFCDANMVLHAVLVRHGIMSEESGDVDPYTWMVVWELAKDAEFDPEEI